VVPRLAWPGAAVPYPRPGRGGDGTGVVAAPGAVTDHPEADVFHGPSARSPPCLPAAPDATMTAPAGGAPCRQDFRGGELRGAPGAARGRGSPVVRPAGR